MSHCQRYRLFGLILNFTFLLCVLQTLTFMHKMIHDLMIHSQIWFDYLANITFIAVNTISKPSFLCFIKDFKIYWTSLKTMQTCKTARLSTNLYLVIVFVSFVSFFGSFIFILILFYFASSNVSLWSPRDDCIMSSEQLL